MTGTAQRDPLPRQAAEASLASLAQTAVPARPLVRAGSRADIGGHFLPSLEEFKRCVDVALRHMV